MQHLGRKAWPIALAALITLPTVPASASPAAFDVAPLSDASLDIVRGTFLPDQRQYYAIRDAFGRDDLRFSAGIGALLMDNWWAGQGAELIASTVISGQGR
ncbi:hypothetical protein SAMN04488241_1096 [Sphingomonas rubra]|uniref:Uncharacterized protein n=2 Tax=Sphingomonas rubra TaxID=634430 RepID=A0A1I5TRZ7_9SPHN|nr:hypothetical protein SAMN04488241_1096 [Sphingomonas rubra]